MVKPGYRFMVPGFSVHRDRAEAPRDPRLVAEPCLPSEGGFQPLRLTRWCAATVPRDRGSSGATRTPRGSRAA